MATKKRKKSKPQRATRGALRADSDSAAAGEQLAKQALAFRAKQRRIRKQREAELDRKRARARALSERAVPPRLRASRYLLHSAPCSAPAVAKEL
jgi:hypothetical protein